MSAINPINSHSSVADRFDCRRASVTVGERVYQVFSAKKSTNSMMFLCFSELFSVVVKEVKEYAERKLANPPPPIVGSTRAFKVNVQMTTESIEFNAKSQLAGFDHDVDSPLAQQMQRTLGLSMDDCRSCAARAKVAALDFFKNRELPIPYLPTSKEMVEEWIVQSTLDSTDHIYRVVGSEVVGPVSYSDEDLKAFAIRRNEILQTPNELSCLGFALFHLREQGGKNIIFIENSDEILKNLFHYLGMWNYYSVTNPVEGDLVVYMTEDNAPKHVGVMAKEGRVHSKLGILGSRSYLHRLFDVMPTYGKKVVFFAKAPELCGLTMPKESV